MKIWIILSITCFTIEGLVGVENSTEDEYEANIYYEATRDTFDLYFTDKRYKNGKVCRSNQQFSDVGDQGTIYSKLKMNFNRSCSYVIGNVVIAHISDEDISFLDSIKEISGYLLVFTNTAKSISLKNLEVIRGENPVIMKGGKYAMAIVYNFIGLEQLEYILLPKLQVVIRQNILIFNNPGLCYMAKINWPSLIHGTQTVIVDNQTCFFNNITGGNISCHPDCPRWAGQQFCWSNNRSSCQKINECRSRNCSYVSKCYINYNYKTEECCNDQCSGGCSGPSSRECLACKNFNNDGSCVEYCPRQIIHQNFRQVKNPEGKLAFQSRCVDKCPVKFVNEHGNCVLRCTVPNTYAVNETCVLCPNGICPKVCHMKDIITHKDAHHINLPMLRRLENCTVYDGNIIINMMSFNGDDYYKMPKESYGIRTEDLIKLEKLQEIYGYLYVNTAQHGKLKNLLFLKNLKIIRANNAVANEKFGLSITFNYDLKFLGLASLTEVRNKDIIITDNRNLCWTGSLNNRSISHRGKFKILRNKMKCHLGHCNRQCDQSLGCWGPTSGLCVRCAHFRAKKYSCVPNCNPKGLFYNFSLSEKKEPQCSNCHSQCKEMENTCSGPNENQCNHGCKKYKYNGYCVGECPDKHFMEDSHCIPCHPMCTERTTNSTQPICTGPISHVGKGGCTMCNHVQLTNIQTQIYTLKCVNASQTCPKGSFKFLVDFRILKLPKHLVENKNASAVVNYWFNNGAMYHISFGSICLPCHPMCSSCVEGINSFCTSCTNYKLGDTCVESCPTDHFSLSSNETGDNTNICVHCHEECNGQCFGPSEYDCHGCRHAKIFINNSENKFFCNSTCGELQGVLMKSEIMCFSKVKADRLSLMNKVAIVFTIVVIISCISGVFIYFFATVQKRKSYDKKQLKLDDFYHPQTEAMVGVQPNMATLLLITESQLDRGDIIGSGAFGVVYKAIWQPNLDKIDKSNSFLRRYLSRYSKENSIKLQVAVKVLTDISDPTNNMQLLEEAKVMASVDHPCCLRILGVCLIAHPQLITQFMPLGCLLEFCQKHRSFINNVTFLNWARQIAFGMEYLESKGIIHCDLAARNVLVQSPKQVKITDFGLAKILDQSQQHYQSKGGRMPIKWLAIECIRQRVFSSKSDVWSYGVTLWEMFTFGEKPFQTIKAFDILSHLEKGQRLSQPKICSIDVYAIMVQCWLVDAESRPSFAELSNTFEMMAGNPNRFLLIQNSPVIEPTYSGLDNDALKYDEFLQALVSVPQLNPDYHPFDQRSDDQKNIRSVKNRYREMRSFKNSFVNYVNENKDKADSSNSEYLPLTPEVNDIYNQSLNTWSSYSQENKRLSNSTLITTLNPPTDYTAINRTVSVDLSDDGYLIPRTMDAFKCKAQLPNYLPKSDSDGKVVFSCGTIVEKEILINRESSL